MKKILHVSKYYYPFKGGTEQIAHDCVLSLASNFDQKVICFNHEKGDAVDYVDGVEVIRCNCLIKISSQSISVSYSRCLKKIFDEYKPDIVIFHYPNPYVCFFLLRQIPQETKLLVYWHLDITRQKLLGKFFVKQNKELIRRADLILATSPNYIDGSPYLSSARDKCIVVPNCINEQRLEITESALQLSQKIRSGAKNKILCLAVGRHIKYKGFKYLIQASKKLDDRFLIYIAGDGKENKKLKKEASDDSKVHFLGLIDDDKLKAAMIAIDIFCFPSIQRNEAFGLALAEGMYFGKPAVTFTIPGSGVNYVCLSGEDGIEVPNKDVSAYAEALKKLADDPDLRHEMGRNGKQRVLDHFLFAQYKENVSNAVFSVISEVNGV